MTELWRYNYLTAGVASADIPNWSPTGVTIAAQTSPLRMRWTATSGTGRAVGRNLTGLTIGADYNIVLSVAEITAGSWTMEAGGTSGALTTGVNERTFTATATTEDLTVALAGTAAGTEIVRLYGVWLEEDLPPVDPNAPEPIEVTGRPGHLRDTIEVVTPEATYDEGTDTWSYDWGNPTVVATLPAYVGYTAASLELEPGRAAFIESLRVITAAFNFQPTKHRIRWKGEVYLPDGPALVRNRSDRPHHLTIPIKAVAG